MIPFVHLAVAFTLPSPLRPASSLRRATGPVAQAVGPLEVTVSCAEERRDEYFALMPSKAPKRGWGAGRIDNFEAAVFARQDDTVPTWKRVGMVATLGEEFVTQAVAKQRSLIVRWAYEACNDFETNQRVMKLDEPIEISWAIEPEKPTLFGTMQSTFEVNVLKKRQEFKRVVYNAVPEDASFDADLRCGFLGKPAREYRGGGVSARFDRIEIGKEPEVPTRAASQSQYDEKYANGAGLEQLNKL